MNPLDTSQEIDQMTGPVGPGFQLQTARIDRGLSIEDVASRMHLSASIIHSIEDNDFEVITAPIFVKGYLRAYARIVSLNEDEMIAQYVEAFSDADPTINTTSSMAAEIKADDTRVKWTTFLVIFVLIVLLGIWWWNQNQNRADVFSLEALQTDTLTESEFADDGMLEEIEAVSETPAGATNEAFSAQSTSVEPESSASLEPEVVAAETIPDDTGAEQVPGEVIQQAPVDAALVASDSEPISRMAPTGTDQLFITINADTWADIKDSGGQQLVYDLLRAGQEFIITGQAPFSVFLGNGYGIEMTYNNELVDVIGRIQPDNTARLKIGS